VVAVVAIAVAGASAIEQIKSIHTHAIGVASKSEHKFRKVARQ